MPTRHRPPDAGPVGERVRLLLSAGRRDARLDLTETERERLRQARRSLEGLDGSRRIYGVTHGFGPLVGHRADHDREAQGLGLVEHLAAGQGAPLPPDVTRTMVRLRLRGMTLGHSAVDPEVWQLLADQWNAGFTPVVPGEGSLSASGDLVPLAHAALASAGRDGGLAWRYGEDGWTREPAADVLRSLGVAPVRWEARSALAFVNGGSACLARALHTHRELSALTEAAAAVTGRVAALLGASGEPYEDALSRVRNQPGQRTAAAWIRRAMEETGEAAEQDRPLQERYSLRCAPQVLGAVLDQLELQGRVLLDEADGCGDNPVLVDGRLLHGGNFHAAPVAFVCETHASCAHQLAFLLERQLALVLDPSANGGLPPLLTPRPGAGSGFAGVQIAATSHLARVRQLGYPASFTALPTNLHNQDQVPMALNSANAVADMTERAWWILGSLLLAVNQLAHLTGGPPGAGLWERLRARFPVLDRDRPLAAEVTAAAEEARARFLAEEAGDPPAPSSV
ncbi:aromatic amino acid ammonia-lyase [Streptomyces huiliensis]|uniref:aromatic amino acid ammonia-lyase n=1 Tax=Streptomyces huiliensis TaxID=2876027 RepID=UPI001CBBBAF9|nr:aromatic amino acid ammonia-lyase [Streptomyces huiliensis]MBZ4322010.1 aromatic amino acid ammonia-lyase [Streptomyces huiliensis]